MFIGQPFIILNSVGSSNNYAMQQVHAHLAEHGTVFFARTQTDGKGQRGKQWQSEPNQNIAMSIVVEPGWLGLQRQFQLSAAVALGCADALGDYLGEDLRIKWPNDIFWQGKKLGGILIENVVQGKDWRFAIAGIGVNVNQENFDAALPNAASMRQILRHELDVVELAKEICVCIRERYAQLHHGFDEVYDNYNNRLFGLDKMTSFVTPNGMLEAFVRGVTTTGLLVTEDAFGKETSWQWGELEWQL
jgi:BirA family transcriptional regulator, biotin operon repressor / biotin---[acetyl-CoA-carboxylase] ligase